MSIYVGNTKVIPLGISKAYVGSTKVYEAVSYDPVFANNTWEQIKQACKSGNIPSTWAVGDTKTVVIDEYNSITVRLVDKTEGRYVYDSDGSYTHATFACEYAYTMTSKTTQTYYKDTTLVTTTAVNFVNLLNRSTCDLYNMLEDIRIKCLDTTSPTGTSENFVCKVFHPSIAETTSTTNGLSETESFKTGSNLGRLEYFTTSGNLVYSPSGSAIPWWTRSQKNARRYYINASGTGALPINTTQAVNGYNRFLFSW